MANDKPRDFRREFVAGIQQLARRHSVHQVFADLMEMSAISISNAVDKAQYAPREARHLDIVKRYSGDEPKKLAELFALLVLEMDRQIDPSDLLGSIFHELELQSKWKGQFFTPDGVSQLMARITLSGGMREPIERNGFFTLMEPTCGAGGMILAVASAMRDEGLNPQRQVHAQGVDIDPLCVHMAYVQCALWHIPAVIHHGNSLSGECWASWYTPAHILGLWSTKLRRLHAPVWSELSVQRRVELCQQHGVPPALALGDRLPDGLASAALAH